MTTKITALETKVLRNIALNQYQPTNGSEPELFDDTSAVWSSCLDCGPEHIESSSIPGVMSSLSKKGLVVCSGSLKAADATVTLTRKGWDAYVEIRKARALVTSGAVAR